jgi:hypothetical protein
LHNAVRVKEQLHIVFTTQSSQNPVNPLLISPDQQKQSSLNSEKTHITIHTNPPKAYSFTRANYSQKVSKSIDIFKHLISRFTLVNMLSYNPDEDTLYQPMLEPKELICFSTIYNSNNGRIIGYRLSNIGVILMTNPDLTIGTIYDIVRGLYTYGYIPSFVRDTSYYITNADSTSIEEISLFHILMPSQPTPP